MQCGRLHSIVNQALHFTHCTTESVSTCIISDLANFQCTWYSSNVCSPISLPPSFCVVFRRCAMFFMTSSRDNDCPDSTLILLSSSYLAFIISSLLWHESGGSPCLCSVSLSSCVSWPGLLSTASGKMLHSDSLSGLARIRISLPPMALYILVAVEQPHGIYFLSKTFCNNRYCRFIYLWLTLILPFLGVISPSTWTLITPFSSNFSGMTFIDSIRTKVTFTSWTHCLPA